MWLAVVERHGQNFTLYHWFSILSRGFLKKIKKYFFPERTGGLRPPLLYRTHPRLSIPFLKKFLFIIHE
jgi:hypothetical protein